MGSVISGLPELMVLLLIGIGLIYSQALLPAAIGLFATESASARLLASALLLAGIFLSIKRNGFKSLTIPEVLLGICLGFMLLLSGSAIWMATPLLLLFLQKQHELHGVLLAMLCLLIYVFYSPNAIVMLAVLPLLLRDWPVVWRVAAALLAWTGGCLCLELPWVVMPAGALIFLAAECACFGVMPWLWLVCSALLFAVLGTGTGLEIGLTGLCVLFLVADRIYPPWAKALVGLGVCLSLSGVPVSSLFALVAAVSLGSGTDWRFQRELKFARYMP